METTPIVSNRRHSVLSQIKQCWRSIDQQKFFQIATIVVVTIFVLFVVATTVSTNDAEEDGQPFLAATPTPVLFSSGKKHNDKNQNLISSTTNSQVVTSFQNGELVFEGNEEHFAPFNVSIISNEDPLTVSKIRIEDAIINASEFSTALQNLTNLESLMLINVTIIGDFSRVYLPHLKTLFIDQYIEMSDTLRNYQEKIHSYIFFDKEKENPWEMAEVANQGVNITYIIGGFTFLRIRQGDEMLLYFDDCDEILRSTNMTYKALSLATCNFSVDSVPSDIIYFNVFDANVVNGSVSELLQKLDSLEYTFLDLPNSTIDLSDFPKSLSTLSLSSLNLTSDKGYNDSKDSFPNMTDLYIGFSNFSRNIYKDFRKYFPNLQRLAAIGQESANYKILQTSLGTKVDWILMEDFRRSDTVEKLEVENALISAGINSGVSNFLIIRPKYSEFFVGIPLQGEENHNYRFALLGWYKFLTFKSYTVADKYMPPSLN